MKTESFTVFGLLYKLSDDERLHVCRAISEACEQSFRRGFCHGYAGAEEVAVDVLDWRFNVPLCESPSPHGTYDNDSLHRHAHEVGLPIHDIEPEKQM